MAKYEELMLRTKPTGLRAKLTESVRSYWVGPVSSKSRDMHGLFGSTGATSTGIRVTEDSAMTVSAVWSAVTMISDDIASLPLNLYRRLPTGGKDKFESHPLYRLLHDAPNPEMDSMVWRRCMQTHVLLWQNAYAEIERDASGRPVAIWPLVPEQVSVFRQGGMLRYRHQNPSGGETVFDPEDIIHLVGHSHNGSIGESLVDKARESLALAMATERFGGTFFGNGATFGGVVQYPGPRPPELAEKSYREQLEMRHQGVDRAHKILALYGGATFTQTGVEPNQAQFLETRVFQIREIARWFKIPPHKLGDLADATFSNVEQQNLDYYSSCLRPWLTLWNQQLSHKLIRPLERSIQFVEHDTHGFLSADAAGRAALYATEFRVGSVTPNDIRGYENRDPLPGGDRSFVPVDMIPLDRVDEWIDAQIKSRETKDAPTAGPTDGGASARQIAALTEERDGARLKAAEFECRLDLVQAALTAAQADVARTEEYGTIQHKRFEDEFQAHAATDAALHLEQARREAAEAEVARVAGEVARIAAEADTVTAGLRADLKDVRAARLVEAEELARAVAGLVERDEQIARWKTQWDEAIEARAALTARADTADAVIAELRTHVETERATSGTNHQHAVEAAALLAVEQAKRTAAEAELGQVRSDAHEKAAKIAAYRTSLRPLLVFSTEWLLRRESDRARGAQRTPEKLRAWIGTFYPLHAEVCRQTLRPVVTAFAALDGADAEVLLDRLVAAHLVQSETALRLVADTDNPDEMAANLDRLLRRWELERAEAVADALLREIGNG